MEHPFIKYLRQETLPTAFCSECGCGTILNAFVQAIDRLGITQKEMALVTGIGCSSWIPSPYLLADTLHTTHGRAIAFATGVKVVQPDKKVVVIAGDGDLAAIGGNHLLHAARRNVGILTILVNNAIYGMTGGQVGPTTPTGDYSTSSPYGNPETPFDMCELMTASGANYVARWTTLHIRQLIWAIQKAITKKGFAFIEVLSPCPTVYGRKVGKKRGSDFLKEYKELSITVEKASSMSQIELQDKIIVGEFINQDKKEFTEVLRELHS